MNRRILMIVTILILLVVANTVSAEVLLQEPVAVVNLIKSEMITKEQLDNKYDEYVAAQARNGKDTSAITQKDVLNIMINDLLIIQGAERDGISLSDAELDQLMKKQKDSFSAQVGSSLSDEQFEQILQYYYGYDLKEYREKVLENYLVDTYVRTKKGDIVNSAKAPSDEEILTYYKKNAASFINPEYVKLSHIFISNKNNPDDAAKALAEKIDRNIRYGVKTYDEEVLEYSEDEGSKYIGGNIGWLAIDDISKKNILGEDFFDTAFSTAEGEISRVVKSNAGYHIIKVLEHRDPKLLTLDDTVTPGSVMTVKQFISQSLYQVNKTKAYNAAIAALLKDLREDAEIIILLEE